MSSRPELGALRAELRAAGVFEFCEARSWLKLAALTATFVLLLVGVAKGGFWAALPLIPAAAVVATAIAMMAHEGSHKSFSASPFRNALLLHVIFPMFGGLGALYWREKHDRLHHGHPNVEGVDPDIKPFPFVSTRGDHERSTPGQRWFQRHFQSWAFWPMSLLMAVGMRRSSILFLARYPKKNTRAWWLDASCMVVHYTGWVVVPSFIVGPAIALAVYASLWSLVGVCLALVFAPAHIGLPIVTEQHKDWVHQLETTRNLRLPRAISFFFIGLDYQVEHHLFPKIPHHHLPRAAAITAAWCAKHEIPYHHVPYLYALVDAGKFIASAWTRDAVEPVEVRAGLVGKAA